MPPRSLTALAILGWLIAAPGEADAQVGDVQPAGARATGGGAANVQAPQVAAFAAADRLYAQGRMREAAAAYEAALAVDPSPSEPHFYLANAYDSLFVPSKRGDPANDQLLESAREHYHIAARLLVRPDQATLRIRSLQFLAHIYGQDRLDRPDDARAALEALLDADPGSPAAYDVLARLHDRAGRPHDAEAIIAQAQSALPDSIQMWRNTAGFLERRGDFDGSIAALQRIAQLEPTVAKHPYAVAVQLEARVRRTVGLPPEQARRYLLLGLAAVDRALTLRAEYFEALTYKNLLLRQRARFESDPQLQRTLVEEADRLQRLALEVRARQVEGRQKR